MPKPEQRDIIEVCFGEEFGGNHPALVISNNLIHEIEDAFICLMMTSKEKDDEFSFPLTKEMLTKPLSKDYAEIRCHLVQFIPAEEIINNTHYNKVKLKYFKKIIDKMNRSTLSTNDL